MFLNVMRYHDRGLYYEKIRMKYVKLREIKLNPLIED